MNHPDTLDGHHDRLTALAIDLEQPAVAASIDDDPDHAIRLLAEALDANGNPGIADATIDILDLQQQLAAGIAETLPGMDDAALAESFRATREAAITELENADRPDLRGVVAG